LAPLPPGVERTDAANAVSPGRGNVSTSNPISIFTLPTTHTRVIPPTLWSCARIHKRRVDNGFRQIRFRYIIRVTLLRDLGFSARQRKEAD
jgi:hypothetical protein